MELVFSDFCFCLGAWGPEVVPLDPNRNSVQNGGSFVSGALTATLFAPKLIFWELVKNNLKYA